MELPDFADGGDGLQMWRVSENILTKQSGTGKKRWSSSLIFDRGTKNPYRK
jgi:hypothetical protein